MGLGGSTTQLVLDVTQERQQNVMPLRWGPGLEKTETSERRGVRGAQFMGVPENDGCCIWEAR